MRCCPESLKEYTAGNSASTPPQRTQTAIWLKTFCKIAVHNAVIYAALLYERNWHNAKLTCSAVLRLIREPVEPRLVGTQKHSDHARPVHFDKLSDRKGRCTSTGPLVCRTNPAGSERFDRLVSSSNHNDRKMSLPNHSDLYSVTGLNSQIQKSLGLDQEQRIDLESFLSADGVIAELLDITATRVKQYIVGFFI